MFAGLRSSILLISASFFGLLFSLPIINGSSQALWQSKVALDVQGRVFATRRMIAWSTTPLALLAAGPLADKIFEPLLAVNGPLAGSIGQIIGTGPGRGIALIFIIMGILSMLAAIAGFLHPRLRMVEDDLPDMISEEPSVGTA
jgi:uncharacterized membrane protein YidH (DUF202 family)